MEDLMLVHALILPYVRLIVDRTPEVPAAHLALAGAALPLEQSDALHRSATERALLAYRIPYLPDVLSSPHLSGTTERERLQEALERQARVIGALWKWKDAAFALRFAAHPTRGAIDIAFVIRIVGAPGQSRAVAQRIAQDVATLLRSCDYPVEPVRSDAELAAILTPFPAPFIVEVRQHERDLAMSIGIAYTVFPFRPQLAAWIATFRAMLEQPSPCVISVHLEPTDLHKAERVAFAEAVRIAATCAEQSFEGFAWTIRLSDPVAHMVAQCYKDYLQRLGHPFLLTVQVASPDAQVAVNVAHALAAEHLATSAAAHAGDDEEILGGFDLVAPATEAELHAARRSFACLDLLRWGASEATEGKERLRYLVDDRAASAVFRFPVPVRGGIPGVRTRPTPPGYDVGPRRTHAAADELLVGVFSDRGGAAVIPLAHLSRHVLIAGTTGSGKTTTCFHLLLQLWEKGIPFLVIESAKAEYRTLLKCLGNDLAIFTLGDESVSPFRLNPLAIQPGVRVETHLSAVAAAINAAIPTFGVLPSLVEQALEQLYLNHGWSLVDRAQPNDQRLFPTLGELYHEIIRTAETRGYSDKTLQDIRGAAAGRIGALLRGSKGRTLNTVRSLPMDELMRRPVVLELQSLTDDEKALTMMFLLIAVAEYCQVNRTSARLQHVTLIEEAHRVMTAAPRQSDRETMADTRAEAVSLMSHMLSEVRAYGEGFIIAEQIPSRLAQDALKNTTTKIVHRLPGRDDRAAIGATMRMDERQQEHVAGLNPQRGEAAFFTDGIEKPTFIETPNVRQMRGLPDHVPDTQVHDHMRTFRETHHSLYLPFAGCRHCLRPCQFRDHVGRLAYDVHAHHAFRAAYRAFERRLQEGDERGAWDVLAQHCLDAIEPARVTTDRHHAAYCCFVHHYQRPISQESARTFREAVKRLQSGRKDP